MDGFIKTHSDISGEEINKFDISNAFAKLKKIMCDY